VAAGSAACAAGAGEIETMSGSLLIAIVDDDSSAREALAGLVRSFGFLAAGFRSGAEFLASPDLDRIACLVADMQMPVMTGLELFLFLAASGRRIFTVLVTAYPDDANRRRALAAGVGCYLVKPVGAEALLDCVRKAIACRAARLD
jgi:FixJ family two-component response regulator